jgi:hypothetical protein
MTDSPAPIAEHPTKVIADIERILGQTDIHVKGVPLREVRLTRLVEIRDALEKSVKVNQRRIARRWWSLCGTEFAS